MGELDHSGFVLDKHQIESETLYSKIAKAIMKIIPAEFKRKINFLEGTEYKKKTNVQRFRAGKFCFTCFFVLQHQSVAHDELE